MSLRALPTVFVTWLMLVSGLGCASQSSTRRPEDFRSELRSAMQQDVATRERRDELSRMLVESVTGAELERMSQPEVRAALGEGMACADYPPCKQQGFADTDWYYLIGHASDPKIKQLPVLMIGWDPQGHAERVFTLQTH